MNCKILKAKKEERVVNYIPDVVYATKDGVDLKLQINIPSSYEYMENNPKLPCMVFVQGSAWLQQNIYFNVPQMARFAKRGFVVVTVQYRHSGIASFPAQIQDAKSAVRFLKMNAEQYSIDVNNMFIWGDSSGAHTALGAGLTASTGELDDGLYNEMSAEVNAIINYNAPVDLYEMREIESKWESKGKTSPGKLLVGVTSDENYQELIEKTNTANFIDKNVNIPPVLIMHGDKDGLVPFAQSEILAKALDDSGKEYEYYMIEGSDHSGPSFFSEEAYDIVEAFVCKNLK